MMTGRPRTAAVHLSLAALLLAGLAACGDPPEYTVPSKACGRDMDRDRLAELLPSGERLRDEPSASDQPFSCEIHVDDVMELVLTERSGQREFDVLTYAKQGRLGGFEQPRASDVSDNAVVSRTRTVVMAPCPKTGKNYILDLDLPNTEKDHSEDLERFARSYLPTGLAALGC